MHAQLPMAAALAERLAAARDRLEALDGRLGPARRG